MTDQQPRDVVFVDVETNGLDQRVHDAWEVAAWNLTTGHRVEFFVHIPEMGEFLGKSEPIALRVGKFLDRYPLNGDAPSSRDTCGMLGELREVLDGARSGTRAEMDALPLPLLVGSSPAFDIGFLRKLYVAHRYPDPGEGASALWHHHPLDLGAYAAGVVGIEPGTSSLSANAVAELCGIAPGDHSAEGDVTSGGRAFLLLREAARRAQGGGSARIYLDGHGLRGDQVEAELLRPPVAS